MTSTTDQRRRERAGMSEREVVAMEIIRAIEEYENSAIPENWDVAKAAAFRAADAVLAALSAYRGKL